MRAGVLCGDRWHPEEVIRQGVSPLCSGDIALDFYTEGSDWSQECIRQYDVLVLARGSDGLADDIKTDIRDYVTQGGGLLVCHSGTVGHAENPDFLALVGGVFVHHPHHCPVTLEYRGDFGRDENDPKTISVYDEHYFVETTHDIEIFLQSTSEGGTQPAGWKRREGEGHVCVLTPGHFVEVWLHPVYQHTLRNALYWCAATKARDVV